MAQGTYTPDPFEQYCDNNGNPLSNGTLSTYLAGLPTPAVTYSDVNLTIANTNPINLDAGGRPTSGAIFLTPGVSYKYILKDVNGAVIAVRDFIAAVPLNPNVTGTWTPVVAGSTSVAGQTYVTQIGTYVQLGTLVIATYSIALSAKGTIVGQLQINGLPFVASSVTNYSNPVGIWENTTTAFVNMTVAVLKNTQVALLYGISAAANSNDPALSTTDISNNLGLAGTLIYTSA